MCVAGRGGAWLFKEDSCSAGNRLMCLDDSFSFLFNGGWAVRVTEGAKWPLLDELLCLSPSYINVSSCISFLTWIPVSVFPSGQGAYVDGKRCLLWYLAGNAYTCMHIHIETLW